MPKPRTGGRTASITPTTSAASTPTVNAPRNYTQMTNADAQNLRDAQDSIYNGTVAAAVKMYISGANQNSPAANIDGQGHSMSQVMNFLLQQGYDLDTADVASINKQYGLNISARNFAGIQYTNSIMSAGAHDIGKDTILVRGAHQDDLITNFGIMNYSNMSESQLQSRLVGATFSSASYMSTSYDANQSPFLGKGQLAGGREVVYNIKAGSGTKVLMGNKAQAEIIINKGTNFKITGVHYTGGIATPRGSGKALPVLQIDLETI